MDSRDFYSFKYLSKSLSIYKKFYRFYKRDFVPITKFEEKDKKVVLNRMEYGKTITCFFFFITSYNLKKTKLFIQKGNLQESIISLAIGSMLIAISSYILMHVFCLKMLFDRCYWLRNRIIYEKTINYERKMIDDKNLLLDEYPFANKQPYLYSDFAIKNGLMGKESLTGNEENQIKKPRNSRLFAPFKDKVENK